LRYKRVNRSEDRKDNFLLTVPESRPTTPQGATQERIKVTGCVCGRDGNCGQEPVLIPGLSDWDRRVECSLKCESSKKEWWGCGLWIGCFAFEKLSPR
jgi:hypothetical protein